MCNINKVYHYRAGSRIIGLTIGLNIVELTLMVSKDAIVSSREDFT